MKRILVDTWAWCALANKKDTHHEIAAKIDEILVEQGYKYVTTNFILCETYTLIRNNTTHKIAVEFGEGIQISKKAGLIEVIHITPEIEKEGWKIFKKYDDKKFSFTDCITFAIMKWQKLTEAFTNDFHFVQFGFAKRPE
ncbi:MAG: PIN domain-containing protein [bacterium]